MSIRCLKCGEPFPEKGTPHCCPLCGGLYDYDSLWTFDSAQVDSSQSGLWRYRHTFGFADGIPAVTIGEGNTPLLWDDVLGRKVAFKCEYANPSGSFKDRGTATLVAFLKARGVTEAVEDSSGNAGASFAAYAARAGIRARVFVPESASGPKRADRNVRRAVDSGSGTALCGDGGRIARGEARRGVRESCIFAV